MPRLALHWQILIAITTAILLGALVLKPMLENEIAAAQYAIGFAEFLGDMFMRGLKMIIVPLILASIICGMASMGTGEGLGRMGGKTLGYYMLSSTLAILVGLFFVNLFAPGIENGAPAGHLLNLSSPEDVASELQKVEGKGGGDIAAIFLRMVPPNIVKAAADGQMLGLICFGLLFGYFMLRIEGKYREVMVSFWQGVFDTMMGITMFVMKFAPLGVFGLITVTVAKTGFNSFAPIATFFATVLIALAFHTFVTMPLLLKVFAKINPLNQFKAMAPALLTAFSTASSSGTLPLTMRCMEKNAGVSNRTTAFVLPMGATINMDGTALYECVAAMFIAQAYGLDLGFTQQFTIVLVALLTSVGVAGIPSASLVAIVVILASVGLPAEGIGLLLITDRILDMIRTAVNVFSDSCCATIVASTEGEENLFLELGNGLKNKET